MSKYTIPTPIAHENLPLLLLQVREGVLKRFRPVLSAHGFTEQQWRIIRAIHERGTLEPREIGELCGLSSPSLAGVLARMDKAGMVKRTRIKSDQRRVLVALTAQSLRKVEQLAPEINATYEAIETLLGKARSKQLIKMLHDASQALN
jgi:homoprotocatechuate degradation regulator HpaR